VGRRGLIVIAAILLAVVLTASATARPRRPHCHPAHHAIWKHGHWHCVQNSPGPAYWSQSGVGGGDGATAPSNSPPTPPPGNPGQSPAFAWIIDAAAAERIAGIDPGLASYFFARPTTFEITSAGAGLEPNATSTTGFADEHALHDAIVSGALPAGTRAVLYDNEAWSATPLAQQQNPAYYYQQAAEVAHQYGLLLIATPSPDLVDVLAPGSPQRYSAFLQLGIAAAAARYADVYDIQAQGSEADPSAYASFVSQAAAQARSANPNIELLAGISTNPSGKAVSAQIMYDAVQATKSIVNGWWLNDPFGGAGCPSCNGPYPQMAVDFLRMMR
jgi:hypothetical protein